MLVDGCVILPVYTYFCWTCSTGVHLDYIPHEWDDDDPDCIDLWGTLMWMCSNRRCSDGQSWKEITGYRTENGNTWVR